MPLPSGPQSLITHRGEAPPSRVSGTMNSRTASRAGGARQHALVLREAARAVGPVPLQHRVERVEERLGRDQPARAASAGGVQ